MTDCHECSRKLTVVYGRLFQIREKTRADKITDFSWKKLLSLIEDIHQEAGDAMVKMDLTNKIMAEGISASDKGNQA